MRYYSNDPIGDYERYSADEENALRQLPQCMRCGLPITEEEYYLIGGKILCLRCMTKQHCQRVEDWIALHAGSV